MSQATDEINKVTGTVIGLSWKLILIAVIILLLIEGAAQGWRFGCEVFNAEPMEAEPGHDITITVKSDESDLDILKDMKEAGLIRNSYASLVTVKFFDYTIYPGTYTLNTSMAPREMFDEMNVRPEGYVEPTQAQTEEETESYTAPAAPEVTAAAEEAYTDEEPSEMVWEAVEAEEFTDEEISVDEEGPDAGEVEIEIRID